MPESPKQQRADRIRDNQRRSRERKKQRIEDLETRVRDFEKLGVEATKAMQAAARRVDDENRQLVAENTKLRSLFKKHHHCDDNMLDHYLSIEPDPVLSEQHYHHHRASAASHELHTMFATRRFLDAPSLVTVDDVPEISPTSPTWPHHHSRRTMSQDYPAYALHSLGAGPQSPGYDAAAVDPVFAVPSGGWGPSGSTSGSAGAQMSSSSGSVGPISRTSHDGYDEEHDGRIDVLMPAYGVAWMDERRR